MKNNIFKISMFLVFFPIFSLAGEVNNGGGGHVCDQNVELYDLFEGHHPQIHNIKTWKHQNEKAKEFYLDKALRRLRVAQPKLYKEFKRELDGILNIPNNELVLPIDIPIINDADIPFVEEGCEYKQLANWNDRLNKLYFSQSLYKKLDELNKAALFYHEAAYKIARNHGATNSDGVRKFVAESFSDQDIQTSITPNGEDDFSEEVSAMGCANFTGFYESRCYSNGREVSHSIIDVEHDTCARLSFGMDFWIMGYKTTETSVTPDYEFTTEVLPRWNSEKTQIYLERKWRRTQSNGQVQEVNGAGVMKKTAYGFMQSLNWGTGPLVCKFTRMNIPR